MVSNDFTFAQKLFGVRTESLPGVPLASIPALGFILCDFCGSVAILAQAIADKTGHHYSPRPEDFRVMNLLLGGGPAFRWDLDASEELIAKLERLRFRSHMS